MADENTTVELTPEDACLVFRANGKIEALTPDRDGMVDKQDQVFWAYCFMLVMGDSDASRAKRDELALWVEEMVEEVKT